MSCALRYTKTRTCCIYEVTNKINPPPPTLQYCIYITYTCVYICKHIYVHISNISHINLYIYIETHWFNSRSKKKTNRKWEHFQYMPGARITHAIYTLPPAWFAAHQPTVATEKDYIWYCCATRENIILDSYDSSFLAMRRWHQRLNANLFLSIILFLFFSLLELKLLWNNNARLVIASFQWAAPAPQRRRRRGYKRR